MVELTHGGTWLKWSSLNRTDRNWALLSFATAFLAALPVGVFAGHWGYIAGYRLGSGGHDPDTIASGALLTSDPFAYAILASVMLSGISAFAWWRFSRNQDEMFNRIQNYALAQAGGWTLAVAFLSWLLSLGGWPAALPLTGLVLLGIGLLVLFWFHAVRRWA